MRSFGEGALPGAIGGALVTAHMIHTLPAATAISAAALGTYAGLTNAWMKDAPHYTTQKAEAKRFLKLKDGQLRDMLRGQSVDIEEIKRKSHFIKIK